MDLRKVKKLIELVEESGIAELEVSSAEESVRIVRYAAAPAVPMQTTPAPVPAPTRENRAEVRIRIKAPMSGTFYAAPSPEAAPFMSPGKQVKPGDVVCIIESMKMMHEIRAESAGEITAILVANGEPVRSGQNLFELV